MMLVCLWVRLSTRFHRCSKRIFPFPGGGPLSGTRDYRIHGAREMRALPGSMGRRAHRHHRQAQVVRSCIVNTRAKANVFKDADECGPRGFESACIRADPRPFSLCAFFKHPNVRDEFSVWTGWSLMNKFTDIGFLRA